MDKKLKTKLIYLANKYEVSSFTEQDPSIFLRHYKDKTDTECLALFSALLSFGNRKQFIPKIKEVINIIDNNANNKSISEWIKTFSYKNDFNYGEKKFYRFYSYNDMQIFFDELSGILINYGSLEKCFKTKWEESYKTKHLADIISASFPNSRIVPKGKNSANKRLHMFLRWMVRVNSPVDLGLWTWYSPKDLLIPLDTHVIQEAIKLNLLTPQATASRKTALELTEKMKEVFPDDPCRADFALFGLGVDSK